MLRELRICNFIIIEDQTIPFGTGLNAISGESGSGKSVVLQALEFVLGRRGTAALIRPGAETAEVQAMFDLSGIPDRVKAELPDLVRDAGGSELLLSRSLNSAGRGKAYVNGRLATATLLEEIGGALLTISSQREHMKLLEAPYHLGLLDAFGGSEKFLAPYSERFARWSALKSEVQALEEKLTKSIFRRAELEAMVEELSAAKLRPGLRAELEQQVKRLGAGEHLIEGGQEIVEMLRADDGAIGFLRSASGKLSELSRHDSGLSELSQRLGSLKTEVDDVAGDLARYFDTLDLDERRLTEMREGLAEVARLERKYRAPDAALCELLEQSRKELEVIDNPVLLEGRRQELAVQELELSKVANDLSELRRKSGKQLCRALEKELSELGMLDAKLSARQDSVPFSPTGADRVEFLIAVNKGGEPQPLKNVASGGELSRFFLASKKTLGERTGIPVLVFDEVDAGVSGKTARAVGEKLKALSSDEQVICITHLPQVASLADHHFTVEKRRGKLTSSVIRELFGADKVDEIARMLAGYEITDAARESAKELLTSKRPRL